MNFLARSAARTGDASLKSGKARFEVAATTEDTDEPLMFAAELAPSALKHSLRDHLLLPFFEQVRKGTPLEKGTRLACSAVEINGQPLVRAEELTRPLRDWAAPGETTRVAITIESVEKIRERRSLRAKREKALPAEYAPTAQRPAPGTFTGVGALHEEPSGLLLILDEIVPATR